METTVKSVNIAPVKLHTHTASITPVAGMRIDSLRAVDKNVVLGMDFFLLPLLMYRPVDLASRQDFLNVHRKVKLIFFPTLLPLLILFLVHTDRP